jgi:hypothetical protein
VNTGAGCFHLSLEDLHGGGLEVGRAKTFLILRFGLEEAVEDSRLRHHIDRAGFEKILLLGRLRPRPEESGTEDHCEVVQGHFVLGFVVVDSAMPRGS